MKHSFELKSLTEDLMAIGLTTESSQRYCRIYKAKNRKWYFEMGDDFRPNDTRYATTFGPFDSEKECEDAIALGSNPGGWSVDKSGKKPAPKYSPNGRPVVKPDRVEFFI